MNKKLYRNSADKFVAGVCSGIADYFEIDPLIIRLLFLMFFICAVGFILYIVAWIIVPEDHKVCPDKVKRLYRSRKQKVIAGICGGLGEYFDKDPVLIRLIVILLFIFSGVGFITYLIAWVIIPYKPFDF